MLITLTSTTIPICSGIPFFYHTQVGGAMEFKITDNFWMGAGVNYEYNPVRRKMEPQFLVYPVFKSGRFKIGM